MIETPQIVQTDSQLTAGIHVVVPRDKIQDVMGPTLEVLLSTIAVQGISPTGPWFTHHFRRPTDSFDFEVCVPIDKPITASGRVQPGQRPAMKVARTVFSGPYDGLAQAWSQFIDWLEINKHKTQEDLWECYIVGPHTNSDPTYWRTELSRTLIN